MRCKYEGGKPGDLFKDATYPIQCPKCEKEIEARFSVIRRGGTMSCPNCKVSIEFKGETKSLDRSFKSVENALKKLDDTLREFNKI